MSIEKAADAAAAVSIPSWVISLIADALPVIQAIAGIVAIVAGVFAIIVHVKKLRGNGK